MILFLGSRITKFTVVLSESEIGNRMAGNRESEIGYEKSEISGTKKKGYFGRRIAVTLSIFNFSPWFFAQIVENRRGRLSRPFLGPRDNFPKSYEENQYFSTVHIIVHSQYFWDLNLVRDDGICNFKYIFRFRGTTTVLNLVPQWHIIFILLLLQY